MGAGHIWQQSSPENQETAGKRGESHGPRGRGLWGGSCEPPALGVLLIVIVIKGRYVSMSNLAVCGENHVHENGNDDTTLIPEDALHLHIHLAAFSLIKLCPRFQ